MLRIDLTFNSPAQIGLECQAFDVNDRVTASSDWTEQSSKLLGDAVMVEKINASSWSVSFSSIALSSETSAIAVTARTSSGLTISRSSRAISSIRLSQPGSLTSLFEAGDVSLQEADPGVDWFCIGLLMKGTSNELLFKEVLSFPERGGSVEGQLRELIQSVREDIATGSPLDSSFVKIPSAQQSTKRVSLVNRLTGAVPIVPEPSALPESLATKIPEVIPAPAVKTPEVLPAQAVKTPEVLPAKAVKMPEVLPAQAVKTPEVIPAVKTPPPEAMKAQVLTVETSANPKMSFSSIAAEAAMKARAREHEVTISEVRTPPIVDIAPTFSVETPALVKPKSRQTSSGDPFGLLSKNIDDASSPVSQKLVNAPEWRLKTELAVRNEEISALKEALAKEKSLRALYAASPSAQAEMAEDFVDDFNRLRGVVLGLRARIWLLVNKRSAQVVAKEQPANKSDFFAAHNREVRHLKGLVASLENQLKRADSLNSKSQSGPITAPIRLDGFECTECIDKDIELKRTRDRVMELEAGAVLSDLLGGGHQSSELLLTQEENRSLKLKCAELEGRSQVQARLINELKATKQQLVNSITTLPKPTHIDAQIDPAKEGEDPIVHHIRVQERLVYTLKDQLDKLSTQVHLAKALNHSPL